MQNPVDKENQGTRVYRPREETHVRQSQERKSRVCVTIGKPPREVYEFFRNFRNLPLFMKDVSRIDVLSPLRTHWVVKLKSGAVAEWNAEITAEIPGQMISWASEKGNEVQTSGNVWFEEAPRGMGTVVRLAMDYSVPGGKLTEFLAMFTSEDPDSLAIINLKRLKAVLETGEFPTVEGQPSGREELPSVTTH